MRALLAALLFTLAPPAASARVLPISLQAVARTIIACHMSLRIDPEIRIGGPPAPGIPFGTDGDYTGTDRSRLGEPDLMDVELTYTEGQITRLEILWEKRDEFDTCAVPLLQRAFPGWAGIADWVRAASLRPAPLHVQPGADRQAVQAGLALVVNGRTLAIYADEYDHGDDARAIEATPHFDVPGP